MELSYESEPCGCLSMLFEPKTSGLGMGTGALECSERTSV